VSNVDSNDPNLQRWYNGVEINLTARLPGGARLFGGTSAEKIVTNSCSAASADPNLLLFCDGTKNGIPWQTNVKLAGTYPLPWYGITVNGAYQGLAGQGLGTLPVQYGVFTAGTGFPTPNGVGTYYFISRTTRYPANCTGPCTPNGLVVPNLTAASVNLPIIAPGTEFTPRLNQIDLGASKTFKIAQVSVMPKIDVFNVLNSDDYTAVASTQWAAATYLQPSVILQGRLIRLGVDLKW
jgi:hypothetical protein